MVENNSIGIFAINTSYIQSDMDLFFKHVAQNIPEGTMAENILLNGAEFRTKWPGDTGPDKPYSTLSRLLTGDPELKLMNS